MTKLPIYLFLNKIKINKTNDLPRAVATPLLVAALGEIIAVMWVYGIHRLVNDEMYC